MSNLILSLQDGLSAHTEIYNDIKNQEIINLIDEYNDNPNDFIDYKNYFNEKCIEDYKTFLVSNIINSIEKSFSKKQIQGDILENKVLFLFKRYKKNIPNFISKLKINKKNFLDYIPEVKKLRIQIKTFEEMDKDTSKYQKKLDVYEKNIFDIIASDIQLYLDNDNISSLLNTFIKYCVKNNKKFINIKINYNEYNNVIISKFTDYKYENLDDMINDLKSNEFIHNEELSYFITKYKIIKEQSFKRFISEFNDIDLNNDLINSYRKPDSEKDIIKHIFIEIIEICQQPFSHTYLRYLENIYEQLNMTEKFNKIKNQNKGHNELIIEYENTEYTFIKDIIKKIKSDDKNLDHYILRRSINHNLNIEEYDDLKKEVDFFKKLITEEEDYIDIVIENYVYPKNKNIINKIKNFNLIVDIDKVVKNIKNTPLDEDNEYIQRVLRELNYNNFEKREKKDWIFVSVNSFFKNNNFLNFMNFMEELENKLKNLNNSNIDKIFNQYLNRILGEFFEHYIKCINNYRIIYEELHPNANKLYYNYNDNKKIRVYINDPIQEILFKIKDNPKKYQYIFQKLLNHLFNYKYYNSDHDINETIIDKITHEIFLIRYSNLMIQINNRLDKPIFVNQIKKYQKIIRSLLPMKKIPSGLTTIINFNKKHLIIDKNGINFLKNNWNDLKFLTFNQIINKSRKTQEDRIDALKFIKLFTFKVNENVKEKKINIFRNNQNQKEKKIIKDTSQELIRILKSADPFPYKYVSTNQKKKNDFFDNYKVDWENIKKNYSFRSDLRAYKKLHLDEKKENIFINLMNKVIKNNQDFLNKKYNQNINFNILYKKLEEEKNRIKIIAHKYHKHIDSKKFYAKDNLVKKTFSDIISLNCIIFFFDNLINMNINFDLKSFEQKENSLINKKIYIFKSGIISKIKSIKKDIYLTPNNIKLNRNEFILYDSLINQYVTITKGNYKGFIGRLMKLNDIHNFTKKNKSHLNKNINDLQNIQNKLKKKNFSNIVDNFELNELVEFRKNLLKEKATQNLFRSYAGKKHEIDVKYEYNIKINPSIRKILNELEVSFIKKLRKERMKNIDYDLNILKNKKKNIKQQYYIRIHEGEASARNLLFTNDEFKFNKKNILKQELKEEDLIHYKNLIINHKYDNLYDFFKYIFNYNNISDNDEYFINIYKESIDIYNINKKNYMEPLNIIDRIEKDLMKLKKNIKKLNNRIKKKINITENEKILKEQEKKRRYVEKQFDIYSLKKDNLMKFKGIKNNPYENDIYIDNNISYFKNNKISIKKDLDNIQKNKIKIKKKIQKEKQEDKEKFKEIIHEIHDNIQNDLFNIFNENPKIKFIDYINNLLNDEETDEEIDDEEIWREMDEAFDEVEEEKEREYTWLELDEMSLDSDF